MTRQLEIGPGSQQLAGDWITLDCIQRPGVDVVCRWGSEPLPFADGSFDLVYASHVLEHVPWYQTVDALREVFRVLAPGGAFEVHVSDLDVIREAIRQRRSLDDHAESGLNGELDWMNWAAERLFHCEDSSGDAGWHRACFNADHLAACLRKAGFDQIERIQDERGSSHGLVNLGMRASKEPSSPDLPVLATPSPPREAEPDPGRDASLGECPARHRHPDGNPSFICLHPKVHAAGQVVLLEACRLCGLRTEIHHFLQREFPTRVGAPRAGLCAFLGSWQGRRNTTDPDGVFTCEHPDHERTTLPECSRCLDFEPRLAASVSSWAVGMTTAPRKRPIIGRALESLEAAGWCDVHTFAEPDSFLPENRPSLHVTWRQSRLGAWANWYLGLAELYLRAPRAEAYLMVQDDAVFCRNVRWLLERVLWPRESVGVVSVYCPRPNERSSPGLFRLADASELAGALALVFPNLSARLLLADLGVVSHALRPGADGQAAIDTAVGRWCRRRNLPDYYFWPSLVDHAGDTSAIWGAGGSNQGRRSAAGFPGTEFDAGTLAVPPVAQETT